MARWWPWRKNVFYCFRLPQTTPGGYNKAFSDTEFQASASDKIQLQPIAVQSVFLFLSLTHKKCVCNLMYFCTRFLHAFFVIKSGNILCKKTRAMLMKIIQTLLELSLFGVTTADLPIRIINSGTGSTPGAFPDTALPFYSGLGTLTHLWLGRFPNWESNLNPGCSSEHTGTCHRTTRNCCV